MTNADTTAAPQKAGCPTSPQSSTPPAAPSVPGFRFFKLSKSKDYCDISPGTIRSYCRQGLTLYRVGKLALIHRDELDAFILARAETRSPR